MGNINLSDEDKQKLLQALNEENELPVEIAEKLFPRLFAQLQTEARFDAQALQRAKIPSIEYEGKRSEAAILNSATLFGGQSPLQLVRYFEEGRLNKKTDQLMLIKESSSTYANGWRNLLVQGDNLQFLKTCHLNQDPLIKDKVKGKVKLVYIDPPFATRADFSGSEGEDSYQDKILRSEFLELLRERIIFLHSILADDGSFFIHLDFKMAYYVKPLLDEIFDIPNFRNEIFWYYYNKMPDTRKGVFPRSTDTLLWYVKSRQSGYTFEPLTEKRDVSVKQLVRRKVDGRMINARDEDGNVMYRTSDSRVVDNVWRIPMLQPADRTELTGYPTQKPEALLERILRATTKENDLVLDVFAGSGTTAAAAEKLRRRWIVCDFGKHAIYTMQKRLIDIASSQKLQEGINKKNKTPYGKQARPFCVVSVGAYDFCKIMNLRENRDAYVSFVLEMFGITDRSPGYEQKYKLKNVYAQKDGDPVMVYPVWEDEYLKNIRIDEEYLKAVLDQAGGKLRGDFYVISPETCTTVSDTEFRNARNQRVTFRLLTFPYKVLEEVSRNFQIEEQPSSPDNINNLVSSVGFYFNQEVKLKAKKTSGGFEIKEFDTAITDREGKRFEGLDGLAMVLVDADYDGEVFKIDAAIYQKDVKESKVTLKGLGAHSALIAIDKFGNESKITSLA